MRERGRRARALSDGTSADCEGSKPDRAETIKQIGSVHASLAWKGAPMRCLVFLKIVGTLFAHFQMGTRLRDFAALNCILDQEGDIKVHGRP